MRRQIGILRKMKAEWAEPVEYHLHLSTAEIPLNAALGKSISICYTGNIFCIQCDRKIKKSFQQGYCFPCYQRLLECNLCVIHPERCSVEQGTCALNDWAHEHCHHTHIVYLANTSGLKVGITRETNMKTRWVDQGAVQAVPIFKVSNRYRAGVIEVLLKNHVKDKTNWRVMLKNQVETLDLALHRTELFAKIETSLPYTAKDFLADIQCLNETPVALAYPCQAYPQKLTSLSFDKNPTVEGTLMGIKGQYLLLDTGVINLRKFGGYEVEVSL